MAAPKIPRVWLEWGLEDTAGSTTTYRWATDDLADPSTYEGGWKEGRARSIGPIDRAVSDLSGEHELGQASVDLDDGDGVIRGLLGTESTSYVDGRNATIKAASDTQRAAAGTATVLMRGLSREVELTEGRGARMLVEEAIGASFNVPSEKQIPQRKFRREMFPDIHRDLLDQVIPIIYGEVSDEGATDSAGASVSKGLCPGFLAGRYLIRGTTVTPISQTEFATLLDPPASVTATVHGTAGTRTVVYGVTHYTVNGETTAEDVTVDTAPDTYSATDYVSLAITKPATYADQITATAIYRDHSRIAILDDSVTTYDDKAQDFATGQRDPDLNTANVSIETMEDGDLATAEVWGLIVFASHPCTSLLGMYTSGGAAVKDPIRVAVELGLSVDVLDPTSDAWPHDEDYITLTGSDGSTETVYGVYVRGPRFWDHFIGRVTIAANICGMPGVDGNTITHAFLVGQDFLSQFVLGNDGKGYQSGARLGLPTFADGTAMINTTAIDTAQDTTATFLGDAVGYTAAFCLTEALTVREWIALFNRTFSAFSYINRFGQFCWGVVNTAWPTTAGTLFREDIDDVEQLGPQREDKDTVENVLQFRCDYDADSGAYRNDLETLKDVGSIAKHKGERTRGSSYDDLLTRDPSTSRDAKNRRLLLCRRARVTIPLTLGTHGYDLDLFTQARVQGLELYSSSTTYPVLTIRRTDHPDEGRVEFECWDLSRVLGLSVGVQTGSGSSAYYAMGDADTSGLTMGSADGSKVMG